MINSNWATKKNREGWSERPSQGNLRYREGKLRRPLEGRKLEGKGREETRELLNEEKTQRLAVFLG